MDIELQEYIRAVSVLVLHMQCTILPSDSNRNLRLEYKTSAVVIKQLQYSS